MPISGLRGIHEIPLGSHLCTFYRRPQDFLGMTASFVKAGLTADELCVWILPPPLTKRLALKELEQQGVNGSMLRDRKQLQIVTAHDWYSRATFTVEASLDRLAALASLVRRRGYASVRAVGGPGPFASEAFRQAFMCYERQVTAVLSKQASIGLCCYPAQEWVTDMFDIMSGHPKALLRTMSGWGTI
jgi:hypothetical protein